MALALVSYFSLAFRAYPTAAIDRLPLSVLFAKVANASRPLQGMFATSSRAIGGRRCPTRRTAAFFCPPSESQRNIFFATPPEKKFPRRGKISSTYRLGRARKKACLAAAPRQTNDSLTGWSRREVGAAEAARCLGREIVQVLRSKGTRLVLHFDLNKTLVMVDPAGRKTQSQVSFKHTRI